MHAADVAVLERRLHLVLGFVFEQLDILARAAAHHGERGHGARIDVETVLHPIPLRVGERPGCVDIFAAQHLGEEVDAVLQLRHRHADMIDADHAGKPVGAGKARCEEQRSHSGTAPRQTTGLLHDIHSLVGLVGPIKQMIALVLRSLPAGQASRRTAAGNAVALGHPSRRMCAFAHMLLRMRSGDFFTAHRPASWRA